MTDSEGVQFLQWCLPRLHLRWPGFRKVRRQVYKRINRRLQQLQLPNIDAYRDYLEDHPAEWATLETSCWISISRFYRDRSVFQYLESDVLPQLAQCVAAGQGQELRCWSAGCAGGEEPYTLAIIWKQSLASRYPMLQFRMVATDIDPRAIQRAQRACYHASSVKQLPVKWRNPAFETIDDELCLKEQYRASVMFRVQDIRERAPEGMFHLILCRNLAFTYFDENLQTEALQRLTRSLTSGGALIIGQLERLPEGSWGLDPWSKRLGTYRKTPASF
jgi:chemotaxis protein methyltransferase CheR